MRIVMLLLLAGALASGCGQHAAPASTPAAPAPPRAAAPAGVPLLTTDTAVYRLRWTISWKNPTRAPASARVEMPLPQEREGFQETEVLSVLPEGSPTETDDLGNRVVVMEWKDVPPGGTGRGELVTRVTRRGLVVDTDARQVRPPGPEMDRYLQAEEHILSEDPVIRQTAANLVTGEEDPYYKAVLIYDFVRSLDFQLSQAARSDAEVLRTRVAQCADAAGLLVSLLRSQGLPSRYVAGVYLRPEEPESRTTHAWAEVWLPPFGWVPMDPTMGRFEDTRLSRLGQLESSYVTVWEGRSSRGFSASGPGADEMDLVLHFEVESREPRTRPVLPPPDLRGTTSTAALVPEGKAGELAMAAIQTGDPAERARLASEGLKLDPGSHTLTKILVTSTPPAERPALRQRMEKEGDHYGLGLLALEQQLYSQAEDALARAGDGFAVRYAQAELFLRTHQPGRAAEALAQATAEIVTAKLAEQALGFFQELGDPAGVLAVGRQAAGLFPEDLRFALAAAQARFRLGETEAAAREIAALRKKDGGNGLYAAVLGSLWLERGDREQARKLLAEGLKGRLDAREREYFADLLDGVARP